NDNKRFVLIGASIMAYRDDVLRYNSYGKEYEVPRRRVFNLSELQRADHIAFYRLQGRSSRDQINKGLEMVNEEVGQQLVSKAAARAEAKIAGWSTFGMAAGQALIPVPAVGAAIGGVVGALVGRFLGNLTGNIVYDNDCEDGVDYYEAEDT
ncbi:unnamed protein product, partial [Porites lobata]